MRHRRFAAAAVAALTAFVLSSCTGSDLPMPPNGPNGQGFSTNNALVRVVNGSPNAGSPCVVLTVTTTCVDVFLDGKLVAPFVPYSQGGLTGSAAILPYASVVSGQVLVQIFASPTVPGGPEGTEVYGLPIATSANSKYSFVLAGQAILPPPNAPFFQGYTFKDGLFQAQPGDVMADFHNASPAAGSVQFAVNCDGCPTDQPMGNAASPGTVRGPFSLIPSGGYSFKANATPIPASALDGANTGDVLPDPLGKPNVNIYVVDTLGSGFQIIGIEDTNG
ncbi:MAG TPA: DUF4397 domain-containing protein [Candidatus Eremiobacteraceae bacterium]